jgi:hypothetical protein
VGGRRRGSVGACRPWRIGARRCGQRGAYRGPRCGGRSPECDVSSSDGRRGTFGKAGRSRPHRVEALARRGLRLDATSADRGGRRRLRMRCARRRWAGMRQSLDTSDPFRDRRRGRPRGPSEHLVGRGRRPDAASGDRTGRRRARNRPCRRRARRGRALLLGPRHADPAVTRHSGADPHPDGMGRGEALRLPSGIRNRATSGGSRVGSSTGRGGAAGRRLRDGVVTGVVRRGASGGLGTPRRRSERGAGRPRRARTGHYHSRAARRAGTRRSRLGQPAGREVEGRRLRADRGAGQRTSR